MATYTLLQIVQQIASSLDSDDINSIADSTESQQIAKIVERVYFDLIKRANLPEHYTLVNLGGYSNLTQPVLMTLPSDVTELKWVKYNRIQTITDPISMELIDYLPLEEFLRRMHELNTTDTYVGSFNYTATNGGTFTILYRKDKQPDFYTTFDDNTIIFDSFNLAVENYLTSSNSLAYAKKIITFTQGDSFVPDLDEEQFPLLLNEATSLAWAELKQTSHGIAERNSRRGWTHVQKSKFRIDPETDFDKLPYFGRR